MKDLKYYQNLPYEIIIKEIATSLKGSRNDDLKSNFSVIASETKQSTMLILSLRGVS